MEHENYVKVAVRIRPQVSKEIIDLCHICTRVTPNEPQVWLGNDKAFTFDHVFDTPTKQYQIYQTCVESLIQGCFEGFNATILAYGQTGSGKTYTMGTGFDIGPTDTEKGIIPRAVEFLFYEIERLMNDARQRGDPVPEFKVNAQFLELYNEDIIDLLNDDRGKHSQMKIHEDSNGQIYITGVTVRPVGTIEDTLQCLKMGALSRTTASTQMNAQSSRSHAIFTLHIKQHRVTRIDPLELNDDIGQELNGDIGTQEIETLTAKFHFVDLAGSERLKRTGATGERAREGISINSGLLALGNVISALGDKTKRATHVPYRDSKLTRLLQDSLGGNSMTLMIACISPSDRDFMETLNTLRYANRAKNIKNKVTANQDKASQTIASLRREIQQLQIELQEYKQGKRLIDGDGTEKINDMYHENTMLQSEINNLKTRIKALQETNERLTARNTELLVDRETGNWALSIGKSDDKSDIRDIVRGYMKEIEELRVKLMEMEEMCSQFRKQVLRQQSQRLSLSPYSGPVAMSGHYDIGFEVDTSSTADVLEEARKDVEKRKRMVKNVTNRSIVDDSRADTNGNEIENNNENGENERDDEEPDTDELNSDDEDDDDEVQNGLATGTELELVELTNDIDIKERLIMELEKTQKRMTHLKQQYEDKLMQLQNRITETESERDRALVKFNTMGNVGDDKAKKVKEEYEKKLNGMQNEMRKLQVAKREHQQAMKSQNAHEQQLRVLRNEVSEMKKQKVKIVSKMKEDAQKHREMEIKNSKRIAQLTKQERQKDIKIRSLEVESNRFKNMIKRKNDEVNALKNRVKPIMSDRVAGRQLNSVRQTAVRRALPFSPVAAKQKWRNLEQHINKVALSKTGESLHEKQMERYLQTRQQLCRSIDRARKNYEKALKDGLSENFLQESREEIETMDENLKFVNDQIDEVQSTITQLDDAKDFVIVDTNVLLSSLSSDEIKYLFDKVIAMAINQSMVAAEKEEERKEFELKYRQISDNSLIQEQLLNHVLDTTFIGDSNPNFDDIPIPIDDGIPRAMPSAVNDYTFTLPPPHPSSVPHIDPIVKNQKARRLTKTYQELLYETSGGKFRNDPMTQSLVAPVISSDTSGDIQRVPSAPSLKESITIIPLKSDLFHSPSFKRKTYERLPLIESQNRSRIRTSTLSHSSSGNSIASQPLSYASRHITTELNDGTPPNSPPVPRRIRDDNNVFSRLTGTITNNQINADRAGHINPFSGKPQYDKSSPLICTHVAEGHTRAVLSVVATNDVLFSGSKDCSVKIWDLHTGQEVQSLCDHPDAVQVVRYNEYSRLAFSVSKSFIKVWDPRDNPARCVKTLNSSGLVSQTGYINSNTQLAPGDAPILDIQLSTYGTSLFSTCSRIVRVWDLRMYHCIGKLSTGHSAGIICMAVEEAGVDNNIVVTGSKDHYIKVFEIMEGVGGIHNPKATLKPPHYDGIESLVIYGDYLFSGSRDACIKKWDLPNQRLVQSLNYCHKDWVQSLSVMSNNNTLISGCRSGQLKLWSTDTCQLMGDIKAHSNAIHSIDTNSALIFTASADNTINLWRWRLSSDPSPDYNDGSND